MIRTEPEIRRPTDRMSLRDTLRRLLHHHRQFRSSGWAWPEKVLSELEQVYEELAPADPIQRIAWLFEPSVALPRPTPEGWQSEHKEIAEERQRAAKALLAERGVDGIFELARNVPMAGFIGAALAEAGIDQSTRDTMLARALRSENARERDLAHGLIFTTFQQAKEPWAAELLARATREKWGNQALLVTLRAIPSRRWTWEQARASGDDVETLYWKRTPTLWIEGDVSDTIFALNKLLEVGRARHALELVGRELKEGLPSELLVKVLLQAANEPSENEPGHNERVMFKHYVAEVLKKLDTATDVPAATMLQLEWAYLPILEYSERPAKVLLVALSEQPAFFMQVVCAVFKPTKESGVVEEPPADMEHAQAVATQAFNLLRIWNRIPGTKADGTIDAGALESWVKEARILADKAGRKEIADQKIGEVLSASPLGEDGIWPALAVREVIEIVRSTHVQTGFVIGHTNRRGVTTRRPGDGGILERAEAEKYRKFARETALEWKYTSAALEQLAKSYEESARWHDEHTEQMDWK